VSPALFIRGPRPFIKKGELGPQPSHERPTFLWGESQEWPKLGFHRRGGLKGEMEGWQDRGTEDRKGSIPHPAHPQNPGAPSLPGLWPLLVSLASTEGDGGAVCVHSRMCGCPLPPIPHPTEHRISWYKDELFSYLQGYMSMFT
jgi:hypothetical protein